MQLAVEALREGELLGVRERLPAKNQDGVLVHAGAYPLERRGIVNVAQLDPRHLGGESRVQLREVDRHVSVMPFWHTPVPGDSALLSQRRQWSAAIRQDGRERFFRRQPLHQKPDDQFPMMAHASG